jgi:hypothetical protein
MRIPPTLLSALLLASTALALVPAQAQPPQNTPSTLTTTPRQSDNDLSRRLFGTWQEQRQVDCQLHRQKIQLRADGTFEVNGIIDECGKTTLFVWRGSWYVRNGRFGYTTKYTNAPDKFPLGEALEDEVISVDASQWVMREQSTGNLSVARRVK